jgi:hypothetical protein
MDASAQWSTRPADERFETLTALRESVNGRRMRSKSIDIDVTRIEAKTSDDGTLAINGTIQPSQPSHWSFGQLATILKAPAAYLRTLPKPLLVDCLNNGVRNADRDTVKFMTVESMDGGVNTLQAVTSPTYGRIWDADAVDCVSRIVERTGNKFYNPKAYVGGAQRPSGLYASDRDVFMFMIDGGSRLDVGPRAQLNRGFIVKNSEVGAASFSLKTFLFNEVCGNHIIWGATDVNELVIRHTQNGPYRFDSQAAPALLAYANSTAKTEMDVIGRAQQTLVCKDRETLTSFLNRSGKFTKSEITGCYDFAKAEEGDCKTLWHVVQGLTAYARGFDYVDARVNLETRAGELLNQVKG